MAGTMTHMVVSRNSGVPNIDLGSGRTSDIRSLWATSGGGLTPQRTTMELDDAPFQRALELP